MIVVIRPPLYDSLNKILDGGYIAILVNIFMISLSNKFIFCSTFKALKVLIHIANWFLRIKI